MTTIEGLINEVWAEIEVEPTVDPVKFTRDDLVRRAMTILNLPSNVGLIALPGETPVYAFQIKGWEVAWQNERKIRELIRSVINRSANL